jgi:hypothetical protein
METKSLDAARYDTDKCDHPHYLRSYEEYLTPLRDQEVKLFELGVLKGGSLKLWRDYFPNGTIVGLDLNPVKIDDPTGRIRVYQGEQQDTVLLDRIARETAPEGFDLFDNHLKPGGLYVIEDWATGYWDSFFDGAAFRYEPRLKFAPRLFRMRSLISHAQRSVPALNPVWRGAKHLLNRRQFRSHDYGLVGFVKELVDECGRADITREDKGTPPYRPSKFKEMRISAGQVFIVKA